MVLAIREPAATAALLTTVALLLGFSALFSRAVQRVGVPTVLGFMLIGVLAGLPSVGNIAFSDYQFAFRLGIVALVLIIFDGGLNTPMRSFRRVAAPATLLATVGVLLTAAILAVAGILLGLSPSAAVLLGAVVSSTDAAAVFSVLRGSGVQLRHRVATTIEVESGMNDPVAVLLTITITEKLVGASQHPIPVLVLDGVLDLIIGAIAGWTIAHLALLSFKRVRPASGGLMAVATTALALLSFGAATLLHGSGFVAVYVAAIIIGSGALPMRSSVIKFHDAFGWLSQITMFLILGLLAFPHRVLAQLPIALGMTVALILVARPIAVAVCLLPFRYSLREVGFIGWVGLRGAVPIVLAIFPVLAGLAGAEIIFDIVFVIVVLNAIVPGSTVRIAAKLFRLESNAPPPPAAVMEVEAAQPLNAELISFYVTPAIAAAGVSLADLPFPEGAAVSMIVRGNDLIPPKGSTIVEPGDHVYVITRSEDVREMQLLFGRPENS
jgi:potassium/hydrogen antiporter